jgi:hypothetical protein
VESQPSTYAQLLRIIRPIAISTDLMVQVESTLFREVARTKSLPHPTARNFDPASWTTAIKELENATERDAHLVSAAIFFGREIARLRATFEPKLFAGLGKRTGVLLSIAAANLDFLNLRDKARQKSRTEARSRDTVHLGLVGRQGLPIGAPGNQVNLDSAAGTLVDTLPHCLERTSSLPAETEEDSDLWKRGARLFGVLSIERSLRDLWHSVLWEGWRVRRDEGALRVEPTDSDLAMLWNVWLWRHEMIIGQGPTLDTINAQMHGRAGHHVKPFLPLTVVGIGGSSPETRRFRFGSLSGLDQRQGWHATENTILEESYLGQFIDSPLPAVPHNMTCRDLQKVWMILRDCAHVLAEKCKERRLLDVASLEQHSLLIRRKELERAIIQCAGMTAAQAQAAIQVFTCNPDDTRTLFSKGLWACPLLSLDDGECLAMVLAPIAVGSAIRRVENWLDRGGNSDRLPYVRRGLRYEAWVRREIALALAENESLPNARIAAESLDRTAEGGEQIDLLIRLGGLLIVGEVKCLLAPVESMERYNYLTNLEKAGSQASRKADWIVQHRDAAAEALGLGEAEVKSLRPVPIVVTNQGIGFGLLVDGARVVDFHFLRLYFQDGEYVAGTALDVARGVAVPHYHRLYQTEREASDRFEETTADPPTLRRFKEAAVWVDNQFPTSDGGVLHIASCHLGEQFSREGERVASVLRSHTNSTRKTSAPRLFR